MNNREGWKILEGECPWKNEVGKPICLIYLVHPSEGHQYWTVNYSRPLEFINDPEVVEKGLEPKDASAGDREIIIHTFKGLKIVSHLLNVPTRYF